MLDLGAETTRYSMLLKKLSKTYFGVTNKWYKMYTLFKFCILSFIISIANINLYSQIPIVEKKSNIGYLLTKKKIRILPQTKRLFIQPHFKLLIMGENIDSYLLLYPAKDYSTACIVPKYTKYTTLIINSKDKNKLSFRGALEVDTAPLYLEKNKELPIKRKMKNGNIVSWEYEGKHFPIFIPNDTENIHFSKESLFAQFANKQAQKGLYLYQDKWLSKKRIKELKKENIKKKKNFKKLLKIAEKRVVILKNGQILHGKLKGRDLSHILFVADGEDYWLGNDDVSILSIDSAINLKNIDLGRSNFRKAQELKNENMGLSNGYAKKALKYIANIKQDDSLAGILAKSLSNEVNSLLKEIDNKLKKENKVIYKYKVFPKYEVDYHIKKGDILLKRKYWIKPEQKCQYCSFHGDVKCSTCKGIGNVAERCSQCNATGKLVCTICGGEGWIDCNICGGKGFIYKKGRSRSYSYFGTSYYYPCAWRPGQIFSAGGGRIGMIAPSPIFCRPTMMGSYMSSGGNDSDAVKSVCWKCGGRGTLQCPKNIKCTFCYGNGDSLKICKTCKGKKEITCIHCKGRGFSGETQKTPPEN